MNTERAIETISDALSQEPSVEALFLSGSHGVGLQDDYSDLDFLLVTSQGATDEIAGLCHDAISRVGDIVLWRDRKVGAALINAITAGWLRIDVSICKPDQMAGQSQDRLKVLFDRGGIHAGLPESGGSRAQSPERLLYQFEEFIRVLGLLHVAIGREEYLNGVTGIFHLRNLLIDLLIEETGAPHRGGALHLNRLIIAEQKELLASLPPPMPERAAVIEGNMAYARAYLPRARRLARQRGVDWPERFEQATWEKLEDALGLKPTYAGG